ncbi:MAG: phosphatidate cytidylyltransferase [Bacteroidales bacterium]|nr:phosphatidate cytidylyltransferase [Clostridium sp.]MCM1202780.1 phosphatidate cytidylyltransferase [Bacteroidales bacterium]
MKNRIIGGFFVAVVTLIILVSGGAVSALLLTLISLVGVYEMLKVYQLEKTPFAVLDYIGTVAVYMLLYLDENRFLFPVVIFLLILLLTVYVVCFPKYKDVEVQKSFFGFIYVTVLLSYVFRIRAMESGMLLSFFILISSWGNDVFAYFVGSALGKHKFSPKVSPNKSVEGFIGGILGAAVLGSVYAVIFPNGLPFSPFKCAVIAAVGAIPAVIGDLAASAIKRDNEIKDYSNLIPGHGGMVDRIDSVLFTAPITFYLVELFKLIR